MLSCHQPKKTKQQKWEIVGFGWKNQVWFNIMDIKVNIFKLFLIQFEKYSWDQNGD